jgi:hypothetical protein
VCDLGGTNGVRSGGSISKLGPRRRGEGRSRQVYDRSLQSTGKRSRVAFRRFSLQGDHECSSSL